MSNGKPTENMPVVPISPAPSPESQPPIPPPELEDAESRALSDALRSSFAIVKVIMALLVIVFFASGVFTVPSQQKAIILRFGKPVGVADQQLLGPGLHWSFPAPIDEIVRIPISEIQNVRSTVGWYATTPEMEAAASEPPPGESLNPAIDGYTITSDANIIHTRAQLQYRITRPLDYTLNFVNASNILQNDLDNALFYVSSHFKVDDALRGEKLKFQEQVITRVRELAEAQKLGVTIEGATVPTLAPRQVKGAFDQVSVAEINRRKKRDEAEAYSGQILSTAQGQSTAIINTGHTEATNLVQQVAAEAQYFNNQLPHYQDNPDFFRARLQAEAMTRILTNTQDKFFLPVKGDGQRQLWLQLNRDPRKPVGTNEFPQTR